MSESSHLRTIQPPATEAAAPALMGHPKGLFYLAFTEAWERFSYYGMTGLLVLYMVNQLLLPGHVEHIAGFAGFRAAVESVVGPRSQALASQIFGLCSGFVHFTPLLGGLIANGVFGAEPDRLEPWQRFRGLSDHFGPYFSRQRRDSHVTVNAAGIQSLTVSSGGPVPGSLYYDNVVVQ